MNKKLFIAFLIQCFSLSVYSQELKARITVNASQIPNTVDRRVFNTLQNSLNNFLNNRKWTADAFQNNEKIECNFILTLNTLVETNVYEASLTIQAARPIYNSSYLSPLVNHQDNNVTFRYIEYQPLEFNENRVQGNDPLASNLTAIFSYYVYMILGFDYDSYSKRGGDSYFQKAQNIVNNAPDNSKISGWKAFDGVRNRYWLNENMINSRYAVIHDVLYIYYRNCFDKIYEDETAARKEMQGVLTLLDNMNTQNPNTMILQFFMQGKANELIQLFSKATPPDKAKASEILQRIDVTNSNRYKDELK